MTYNVNVGQEKGKPFDKSNTLKFVVKIMSNTKNANKSHEKHSSVDSTKDEEDGEGSACKKTMKYTYSVTVSKKQSDPITEEAPLYAGRKSFISIHSTDQPCQLPDSGNPSRLEECNVEVLSLNKVFPSTSEESLSNEDESTVQKKRKNAKSKVQKPKSAEAKFVPTNSKSSTVSGRQKESLEGQGAVHSDVNIPKNTLYVVGSNPGEPKKTYQDPPKKISKTMKKFLRNIDKHKNELNKSGAKSKLTTMRGILKDGRCGPECTGDSSAQGEDINLQDHTLPFQMDFDPTHQYTKQGPDKNVTFNTQVVIIHFTGDLCVGQSVEALSKEKDQQARNSELRKTYLTKYNEFWPTQK